MYELEQETYRGYDIKIHQDEDPEDPREWGNLGKMVCSHKRYSLPNELNFDFDSCESWAEAEKELVEVYDAVIVLPLYMYDHSGLRIKVGSFNGLLPDWHAYFDSGQIGFIVCRASDILKEYCIEPEELRNNRESYIENAKSILLREVENYDYYVAGFVYGFIVENPDGEHVGSCCGFYGDTEYPLSEARQSVDYDIERVRKLRQDKLKQYIRNKVPLRYRCLPNY